ncbi:ATP-dependent DNA helicase PIF1 [Holothuria leucospilota]|uniref:ATP-dependent DNA helicase n=1 Tax=Holothuria leucospilota TaxID=206669 RepID=A0A9Q1CEM9_HOLLE|nr:ATP-dependent DNA helicase PIF1 [Holothuria leucospilota]
MLQILDMTEDQYIQAIRWSLTAHKLFLKRSPSEIRVNAYNKTLLETWKANMDIQYVLDPYACAMYIVSYISKGQRGMSNLMQRATKEAKDGNHDIKQRVRHIGNKFLNHVELSAQEAVYLILQMSLRKATRQFVIQELPDDSTDVECMGLIKKYSARPKVLENYCLADFAALFDVSTSKSESVTTQAADEIENEDDPLFEKSATDKICGAGVGKSQVLKGLYNALLRYYSTLPGNDPDDTNILLMAPTGKAAYCIKGTTIHCALHIPANQGLSDYKALTNDKLNSLQVKYHNLKIIFIDEISMVGHRIFRYIDQRLQQIMGSKKVFGGVSIIAVGDLFQVKPVKDGSIFKELTDDYGPLATNLWKSNFTAYELTEIMRQKDDQAFAQLLNRLREGNQTSDDLATLAARQFTSD